MDGEVFLEFFVALLLFGIPAAALAVRFVLRPMLREITEAIRSSRGDPGRELERRVTELEESHGSLARELRRLLEEEGFRQRLEVGEEER